MPFKIATSAVFAKPSPGEDAALRLAFVQIQAYRIHRRLASVVCDVDRL